MAKPDGARVLAMHWNAIAMGVKSRMLRRMESMDKAISPQLCTRLSKVRRDYLSLLCLCSDEGMAVCHVFAFYAHRPKSIATTRVHVLCVYGEHVCGDLRIGKNNFYASGFDYRTVRVRGVCVRQLA